jgi:hypothetical protein
MIKIRVDKEKNSQRLSPYEIFGKPMNSVFQMYSNDTPCDHYYISLGLNDGMITLYVSDHKWSISTVDKEDFKDFNPWITFKLIDADLNIELVKK